jgi:CHAT domain-containing protein
MAHSASAEHEDGILTAEEIAALDLENVEMAVLSACETGGGTVLPREGILGLQRAFRVANAGALVVSLWPVEDAAASAWMEEFYRSQRRGLGTAQAARHASIALMTRARAHGRDPNPAAWAAFVVIE